ncbi:universal stress protein [Mycolicibacterium vaccae]|uniref:universal stress protein n=1 Tax=Mycolicibacterium vaccae TaxID=1810 RepID=UPI003CEC9DCF
MTEKDSFPCVAVGIDGSPAAVDAALWAVEYAVAAGVPLRLVYVIEPSDAATDPPGQARRLATAELAVRYAMAAVESTELPVDIEIAILRGPPVRVLLDAARTATMLCVGARGLRHAMRGRIGSTAAAVAAGAHCPVAIVRAHRPHSARERAVVAEFHDVSAGRQVMRRALEEAQRRHAPARLIAPPGVCSELETRGSHQFAQWSHDYPGLDISPVSCSHILDYLRSNAPAIQLLVVGRGRAGGIDEVVGAPGHAALRDSDCSILVV